jgi:hypothetical protein
VAALALVALAGCSSSTPNTAASGSSAPATSATTTATSSAPAGGNASGSNVGLSDSAIRAAFDAAVKGATAMHVTGTQAQQGQSISLDLGLNKDDSTEGTITLGTAKLPVKAVGGVVYAQMTPSFIQFIAAQQHVSAAPLAALANKWITSQSASGKSLTDGFSEFMNYSTIATNFAGSAAGDPAIAAGTTTLNGQTVAYYTTKQGSKLYFAATGPAYLLREDDSGSGGTGSITITWNQPAKVTPPPASDIVTLPAN